MIKKLLFFHFWLCALIINAQIITSGQGTESSTDGNIRQTGASEYYSLNYSIFSVPAKDLIVIQKKNLNTENTVIELFNNTGKVIQKAVLYQGSTITFFDTKILYDGEYTIKFSDGEVPIIQKITIIK